MKAVLLTNENSGFHLLGVYNLNRENEKTKLYPNFTILGELRLK